MILTAHLALGALIGQKIANPISVIMLAFLSHYFLDILPHTEYSIENIKSKQWKKSLPEFLKVFWDFCFGIFLILIFSNPEGSVFNILLGCFFAILPDGLGFLNLKAYNKFHQEKIHALKKSPIPVFWRWASQTIVVLICLLLLKF